MKLSNDQLAEFARSIAATSDNEIDCEEMLSRAVAFIEVLSKEQTDLSDSLRVVAQHLGGCAERREEVELLIQARFGTADEAG